jgi:hypothetical protein
MPVYQHNDRTDPEWVLAQLNAIPEDSSWAGAAVVRARFFLRQYNNKEIDKRALKFNLVNIKGTKQEYATYEEKIRKNILDDFLNPLIDIL